MDIPLVLRKAKDGRLIYAVPLWYRIAMLLIGAVLVGAILVANDKPSAFEWVALALTLLAALYEERWTLDPAQQSLTHRYGLAFLARKVVLPFSRIEGFRLRAFVKGTAPGGRTEASDSARILGAIDSTGDVDALRQSRSTLRKAFVTLLCDDLEGGGLVFNTLPARRAGDLIAAGQMLSQASGLPFEQD